MLPLVGLSLAAAASAQAGNSYPPTPIGVGPRFHLRPATPAIRAGRPVGALRCGASTRRFGAHIELFAHNRVVIVPASIGVATPFTRAGAFVRPGGCTYPLRTLQPTGVVQVTAGRRLTLSDLFRVWGQPLSRTRLASFRTSARRPVRGYLGGRRWRGPLAAIPLRRHAQIVLELGRFIRPHRVFLFPAGL